MNKNKLSFFVLLFALFIHAGALRSQSLETIPKIGLGINGYGKEKPCCSIQESLLGRKSNTYLSR